MARDSRRQLREPLASVAPADQGDGRRLPFTQQHFHAPAYSAGWRGRRRGRGRGARIWSEQLLPIWLLRQQLALLLPLLLLLLLRLGWGRRRGLGLQEG